MIRRQGRATKRDLILKTRVFVVLRTFQQSCVRAVKVISVPRCVLQSYFCGCNEVSGQETTQESLFMMQSFTARESSQKQNS